MTLKEKRSGILAQAREIIEKAVTESRAMTAEEKEQHDAFIAEADALQATIEAEERMSARFTAPTVPAVKPAESRDTEKANDEYRSSFFAHLAGKNVEKRGLTVGDQGVFLPSTTWNMVIEGLKQYGGVRATRANVLPNVKGTINIPVSNSTVKGHRTNVGPAATVDPSSLVNRPLTTYEYTSDVIVIDRKLMDESPVAFERYLAGELTDRIAKITNEEMTIGDGVSKPQGVLAGAGAGKVGASTTDITYEELLELFHSVPAQYRQNAEFMMADATLAKVRKIVKTGTNELVYDDKTNTLLGRPVVINDDMPSMSAGAKSLIFGDFSRYAIADGPVAEVRVLNEMYSANNQVGFVLFSNHGGVLADSGNAIKYFQNAAV